VEEALSAYTLSAAYAGFQEKDRGSLQPGKLADFVVLNKDLRKIPAPDIRLVRVEKTFVGGKIVYQRD
jgi:predicted amidohydrolase YtcJ